MKSKLTQEQRVINKLLRDGFITRNEALRVYISRLGAIVCSLQSQGYEFDAKYDENRDYVYTMTKCPLQKVVYTVPGRGPITTYKK